MTEFEKYIKEAADRLNIEIEGIDLDEAQKLWNAALEAAALKCEEIGDSSQGSSESYEYVCSEAIRRMKG